MRLRSSFARPAAAVCVLFGLQAAPGCGGAVPTPKEYVTYHSTDGRIDCDCPKGWETEGGGKLARFHGEGLGRVVKRGTHHGIGAIA